MKAVTILAVSISCALAAPARARGVEDLVREGDAFYARRAEPGMADLALEKYQKALAIDPGHAGAYWKVARLYFHRGMQARGKAAEAAFREAIEYAKMCVAVADAEAGCHFWLGAAYGKFGQVRGVMQSLYLVPYVRAEMERVIELDRGFNDAGADLALGRMNFLIPGFLPADVRGDRRKALAHLRKAVELAPDNPLARLWLAEALIDAGMRAEARGHLQRVLELPPPADGPADEGRDEKAAAREMLGRL